MTKGQKVICNGYEGVVTKIHQGQLEGMADVRLERGSVCVDITGLHVHDFTLDSNDTLVCACGERRGL